jgi:hypothetical protein
LCRKVSNFAIDAFKKRTPNSRVAQKARNEERLAH